MVDRNAEIAFRLDNKYFWSIGIMFEGGTLLLKHALIVLNIYRVYYGTSSNIRGMQNISIKPGMKTERDPSNVIFKNGDY